MIILMIVIVIVIVIVVYLLFGFTSCVVHCFGFRGNYLIGMDMGKSDNDDI